MNLSYASFRLDDPRDLSFALHALLGRSPDSGHDTCRAVAAQLPPAPTVAQLVDAVFAHRADPVCEDAERVRAMSLLAAYFAIDPPVEPDPSR